MKIKDYKCKCGHDDFFFADKGNQQGIYCSYCGKWYKWADKDEQNLAMKQEPFMNKACVSSKVCEHDKKSVLDKIKAEIKAMFPPSGDWMYDEGYEHEQTVCEVLVDVLQIIDKHKAEGGD